MGMLTHFLILRLPTKAFLAFVALLLMLTPWLPNAAYAHDEILSPRQFAAVVEARDCMENGVPEQAVTRLMPLSQGARPPLTILSHLAWAQSEADRTQAALSTYQRAATLYPSDARTHRNLGLLLLDMHKPQDAAKHLERAYDLQPKTSKEPSLLAQAASALARADEHAHALALLDRACNAAHNIPIPWTALAVHCCLRLEQHNAARTRAVQCTHRHPDAASAWRLLGQVLSRTRDPLGAAAAMETARALAPSDNQNASNELAALYARGHAHGEAARHLASETTDDSLLRTARLQYMAGQYTPALALLEHADNDSAPAPLDLNGLRRALLRGRILLALGRTDDAVRCLTDAGRPSPLTNGKIAHRLRANALLLAGGALWLDRDWNGAATVFDTLGTVPGYARTGSSLAASMRGLVRRNANTNTP